MPPRLAAACVLILLLVGALRAAADDQAAALEYFEREVRPLLVSACSECHGEKKQESSLRVDSRASLLAGGVSGAAIVPGEPDASLLIAAVRHADDVEAMPPDGKLTEPQIAALVRWIELGAPWPAETSVNKIQDAARTHWAFQPVADPPVPSVRPDQLDGSGNPIDAFVASKLDAVQLKASPPADKRTLIRRVTYDLLGLPPTAEEVAAFEADADPKAYENLVDRLLASPRYGEQWGRHWLDVARYSDTKGYVYGREQRFWPHAWVYRDWVVKALNDDMPYNRFLLLQIAADQAAPEDKSQLAAMGFLTLNRRFLGVTRDIIDDRIDVVTRGTMGLTVACARCHDHKYDAIPTRDYYSLYGVFQSCSERLLPTAEPAQEAAGQAFQAELAKRQKAVDDLLAAKRNETQTRLRARTGDYLAAQFELAKYPVEGFDQIFSASDMLPTFVHRWREYLAKANERHDRLFAAWHAFAALPADDFTSKAASIAQQLQAMPASEASPLIVKKFTQPPTSMLEVAQRYGELFTEVDAKWQVAIKAATDSQQPAPQSLPDADEEAARSLLYEPAGPCVVPDEPIANIEYFIDSDANNQLWKLQNEVENWILQAPAATPHTIALIDRDRPATPRVFKRGNPATPGDETPRQFVSLLTGESRQPFQIGSGRLELAQAIVDPQNPLTARVLVNRVWLHHFGAGLVRSPSDFGVRAEAPSHPELLDWLTKRFVEDGWSLKKLHRRLMLSRVYSQSSTGPADAALVAKAIELDPQNRLLWRASARRLTFEELRDSLLAASGTLDRSLGGKPADLLAAGFRRRTLYGTIDRQFLPGTLRVFDFANPDLHIPQRSDTTSPQQALFFLNDPLPLAQTKAIAAATSDSQPTATSVQRLYQRLLQRPPTPQQTEAALAFLQTATEVPSPEVRTTIADWQYGFGAYDEASKRVAIFEKLPHSTGTAWQGGAAWPDSKLGWVQLTAIGGHPGNDLQHAAIRRWTAPRNVTVKVASLLAHEPSEGQGVRGFVVSSRSGLVGQAHVHHGKAELAADSLELKAGDTLDFVADIGPQLSHNQFLWKIDITPTDGAAAWDSQADFGQPAAAMLTPWEQLTQALLSSNEFMFVD